jgi:Flp pilus assembly protein TadG
VRGVSGLCRRGGRRRGESGSALVEVTWLAILLLVPLVWIMVSAFEVQRGAFAVTAAARAAGRAYALAPDEQTALLRATAVAQQTLDDQGTPGMEVEVEVTCSNGPGRCLEGTSVITVEVVSAVRLPAVPEVLRTGRSGFRLEASHTVPVGQYVQAGG